MTVAEWEVLGERGQEAIPEGARAFVSLGAILADATPDESRRFVALLPVPARLLWRVVGTGIHRREVVRIHGS